jgi:hypothetical protein
MSSTKKEEKGTAARGGDDNVHNRRLGEMLAAVVSNPRVSPATKNVIEAAVVQMCDEAAIGVEHHEVLPAAFAAAARDLHPEAFRIVRETLLKTLDSNEDGGLIERIRAGAGAPQREADDEPRQASRQVGQRPDLAELLSAVMKHPDIPTDLHTHIGDWITSYGNPQVDEPERIRRALAEWGVPGPAGQARCGATETFPGNGAEADDANITPEDAARLAGALDDGGDNNVRAILLLCRALTYGDGEEGRSDREEMWEAIQAKLAPYLMEFGDFIRGELHKASAQLRAGAK